MKRFFIRSAQSEDTAVIFELVRALADYERLLDQVDATQEMLSAALFCEQPRLFCDVVETEDKIVGFVVWFYNFSTFRGRHGIYIEDLFVRPEARGRGYGKALLSHLAARCVREGLARLEWSVLDWNEPSIAFYQSHGAQLMNDWTTCRVSEQALWRLADERQINE
jgi:GNAT superfamily N-acetyltransferase